VNDFVFLSLTIVLSCYLIRTRHCWRKYVESAILRAGSLRG